MTGLLKCVVWDLDNTLWRGTLAEGDDVQTVPLAQQLVERLEHAGIVQSVASKNDPDHAAAALTALGFADRFVYPQISWSAKSTSVRRIGELLNIATDAIVLLDDSAYERAEVAAGVSGVRCYSLPDFAVRIDRDQLLPSELTAEAARRPDAYRQEANRKAAEAEFAGAPAEFLASLNMVLNLRMAGPGDLDRASELTERTSQLNTTGHTFTPTELAGYADDPNRHVLVAELQDRFGDYGRVGLCLVRRDTGHWLIELLLMSCRVMGRNVGTACLGALAGLAARHNVTLRAYYRPTPRNRQMRITYGFLGFTPVGADGDTQILGAPPPRGDPDPGIHNGAAISLTRPDRISGSANMTQAFTNRWVELFGSAYDGRPLAEVPWFTAAPGLKIMEAVINGLITPGSDVVDLGCGPGSDAVFLAVAGARVTGVDSAPAALDKARALAAWAGVDVNFRQAGILDTGLEDGCADVVNDSFVFHNISDEARPDYAAEVHRITRPGGVFLLNAFSDRMVEGSGPRRITSREIFDAFPPDRFDCTHLEIYRNLPTAVRPGQFHWFGIFRTVAEQ